LRWSILFLTLIQQPRNAFNSVGDKLLAAFELREHAGKSVWDPRIHMEFSFDAKILSKDPFVYQSFVTKRVQSADLEKCWWKPTVLANAEDVVQR